MQFSEAERLFRNEDIRALAADRGGRLYLKLRSLSRSEYLVRLLNQEGVLTSGSKSKELFQAAYAAGIAETRIDTFIKAIYKEERKGRLAKEGDLVSELYKLEVFDWGGLHQNSLEKTIVDNYIKKISKYEQLEEAIEGELQHSLRGYVLCSWYNHWTSILIEDVFRDHENVLPAIGQVKKIDFFVRNTPFDLKVTYLPEGYVSDKRKSATQRPELTLLKGCAREFDLPFDNEMPNSRLLEDLWKKVSDHPNRKCQRLIGDVKAFRSAIIDEIRGDPTDLITWLYENQGVRRFDASNRLFLVLVDTDDFFGSWKLKRALPRLKEGVCRYLDGVPAKPGHEVVFQWEGTPYSARSDAVLVTKP
jgi:hypothetical protein